MKIEPMTDNSQTKPFWKSFNKIMWYALMIIGSAWLLFFVFISIYLLHGQFWLLPSPFSWIAISNWLKNYPILEEVLTVLWIASIPSYVWMIAFGIITKKKRKAAKV